MSDIQTAKAVVAEFHRKLDGAGIEKIPDMLAAATADDYLWRGYHPFHEMRGAEVVAARFWQPLRGALRRMQRRQDIFFAGHNEMDGEASTWVVSMGHLMGLFDAPWLGIAPTRRMAFLRYCEFHRVEDGRIAETALYFDLPHFMVQAGLRPFPPQTAAHLVQPGPLTHDGLLTAPQDPAEGAATLALINAMISDLGQWNSGLTLEEELARTWADDMIWWGPEGIGATYTIPRYAEQHSGPFRAGFTGRSRQGICAGWPRATMAASSAGQISPRHRRGASWGCRGPTWPESSE